MSNRRQENRMRSEYGAATVLVLIVLMVCALAGIMPSGFQSSKGGTSAQVVNADGFATEGGTGRNAALIKAGSPKTASLQAGSSVLRTASNDDAVAPEDDAVVSDADTDENLQAEQPIQNEEETNSTNDSIQLQDDYSYSYSTIEETQWQGEKTIEKRLACVDGMTYLFKLTYDATAQIPDDAQLELVELNESLTEEQKKEEVNKNRPYDTERFVSKADLDKRGEVLDRWLKLTENDYRFFTKYINVLIVSGDRAIKPAAPVEVTIETIAVSRDEAGTLEVALWQPVDNPTTEDPYAYKVLGGKNDTNEKDSTSKVTFVTDELGELAIAGVAYSMGTWDLDGMTINIMGPRGLESANMRNIDVGVEKGRELREAFTIDVRPMPEYGTTLWISAKPVDGAATQNERGELLGYRVEYGKLIDRLFGSKGTAKPKDFQAGEDGVALIWDYGYRHQSLDIKKVSLEGMLPEDVTATATSVVKDFLDYASISKKLTKAAENEGLKLNTVAAYDISMAADGEAYQPSEQNPVTVSISSTYISEDGLYQVWHVRNDGSVEVVEDATVEGDTVSFEATDLDVFMVVETTKETTLTTDDGKTYRVQVTYDNTSGIPEDAELEVAEIKKGQNGYKTYVEKTAKALDTKVEDLTLARAFDITLKNPDTGDEYQPSKDVRVSIELLDENLSNAKNVNVVHISDESDAQAEVMAASVSDGAVEFATDGFSVYVVTVTEGESTTTVTPQCTFTFYVPNADAAGQYKAYSFTDDQGNTIYKQTIKSGEELIVPQVTSTDTESFAGWYEGSLVGGTLTLAEEPYDFNSVTITENSAIDLYAVYKSYATVYFHDQYDNEAKDFPVAFTRRAELVTSGEGATATTSATVQIDDLSTTYTNNGGANMAFLGWSETSIKTPGAEKDDNGNNVVAITPDEDGCITVTGEKHLYPIYKETHRLTFYAAQSGKGADYVPSADYFAGEAVPTPLPKTAMEGYVFQGWFTGTLSVTQTGDDTVETVNYGSQITAADGNLVATADDAGVYIDMGELYLRADATLYAKWEPATEADYTIVVKTQDPSDSDAYVYRESAILTGTIGESVSVPEVYKNKTYQGYNYARCDDATTVAADGSTVLNVYYDKNSDYTPSGSYTLTFTDSVTEEGKTASGLPKTYQNVSFGESITDKIPADPTSGRNGYEFSDWYLDEACTIPAKLTTMPDHDLTIYAGWETGWYVVTIDPNYGALYTEEGVSGTGATWFWNSFTGEPIGEYTHVTRDYEQSSAGTWYYVNHQYGDGQGGNNGWPDRKTFYTQDPSKATEDTAFEYAPGTYTYAGWYEVYLDENGNEIGEAQEPYDFTRHTDHNTKLRLRWKKSGTYYLAYDAGEGTLDDGSKSSLLPEGYADNAGITLTEAAQAPMGYTFVGWRVSGSDSSMIYRPGQTFTLHAEDTKRVGGKDVVYLDAVYVQVGTARIIYNANGGTVADGGVDSVDFGQIPGASVDSWVDATGTVDTDAGTATVSGLTNNTKVKLSSGTGFTAPQGSSATFVGWSNKATCDASATIYSQDANVTLAVEGSTTLYAAWRTQISYSLGSTEATWGSGSWDPAVYTLDGDHYTQAAYLGTTISEPAGVPEYTGSDGKLFRYWATRTGDGTDESPYVYTAYDFSKKVTGAVDLYAYWEEPDVVTVHAVDATADTLIKDPEGWTVNNIVVSTTEQPVDGSLVQAPANYDFAFAAVASDIDSVSENNAVVAIRYKDKRVEVQYKGESSFRALGKGSEIYCVYYQTETLPIGYKSMEADGVLDGVTTTGAPATTTEPLGTYAMHSQITNALSLASGFTYYAFAIGSPDNGTQMNASNLSLITTTASSRDDAPVLWVRNTWRGFQYTTEGTADSAPGDDAEWIDCGYTPQLYVIYYTQQPTVVMFGEKTVGTSAVIDTEFTYNLKVTQATTTTVREQKQIFVDGEWVDDGDAVETSTSTEPTTIFDTTAEGNQPYILKDGQANSSILFYERNPSTTTITPDSDDPENKRLERKTTVVTAQTAVITQVANDSFTTKINDVAQETEPYEFTYTANGTKDTQNVTFTNTHKSLPVEIHVAMVENDGEISGIIQRDTTYRNADEATYTFNLALGGSEEILTRLPSGAVFTGNTDDYAFGAVVYGTGTEGSAITIKNMGVTSIAYAQTDDNVYELVLKDAEGNVLDELGSNKIYYLYYPMAKIRYVKEADDGTLTDVKGCLPNTDTGVIEPSDSITYDHALLTMNGKTVAQNESFEIPLTGFVISQNGNNFRMPPVLDDGLYERYLSYVKIGAGGAGLTDIDDIDVSDSRTMQLKVQNNTLQYSFDGETWKNLPLASTPTIYAIYTERGYDLQVSKTVDTSQSGENAIFSNSSYTVTISSMAITKAEYDAEGAESSTISATPAIPASQDTPGVPGTITFTAVDGTKVRIKGMSRGDYTITESGNENYTLTAKSGPIVGGSSTDMQVIDNTTVSLALNTETKVDLINSPKAICKIGDHYFYTLRSMVDYVDNNITSKTATAEMLTDYLMPAADTMELPSDFNLTLTTANSLDHPVVITRTSALAGVPMITNHGTLTLTSVTLEGGEGVEATAPVIQSSGNLTIGGGSTIQNANGGGAINATAGDITISGTIQDCSAAEGGAIHHTGNSTITLSGTALVQNNTATSGNGGAINLASGTIKISGSSSISGNEAENGNGGAIYTGSAEIDIDQNGSITGNTAKEGGAIYAQNATITISKTENTDVAPAITGNTATTGDGGAIRTGGGSVSITGGSVSNNHAASGRGGAVYANTASVTVSGVAEVKNNNAGTGGAIYAESGTVSIAGGEVENNIATAVENNTAATGNGGAVYAGSGDVTVSGGSVSSNEATDSGGAVYADTGKVAVTGGSLTHNTAQVNGGAICAGSGTVTLSVPSGGTAATIQHNTATTGDGGAIYASDGAVSITGITLTNNAATAGNGGAVYAGSGAVTLTNSVFGGDSGVGNTAGANGGAVYAASGNVTMTGSSMTGNTAATHGGALYIGSGAGSVTGTSGTDTFASNTATAGNGGAIYLGSDALALASVTATDNNAVNGAAVYVNTGRATFTAGTYSGNTASNGGAVGAGDVNARLYFTGDVRVTNNTLGTGADAPKSNVYLDQDDDAVINIDTLGSNAAIGIYVPDSVVNTRSVPGARFAVYTNDSNMAKITNDRFSALTVQKDTGAKKFFWGNSIKISVCYIASYANGFPPSTNPNSIRYYTTDTYNPELNDAALSELAAELYQKQGSNYKLNNQPMSSTAVYAGAYLDGEEEFGNYLTRLTWNSQTSEWIVTKRDGSTESMTKGPRDYHRIYIYYSEPAYISIENNTDNPKLKLDITNLTVRDATVINTSTQAGYGMVFAKNGAIRTALLPITAEDLELASGQSITLLIPGGQNMAYTLDGAFTDASGAGEVRLRRTGMDEVQLSYSAEGAFDQLTGTTLNGAGTYSIIFGDDKVICKVVDTAGVEHPYSTISGALADIVATNGENPPYALAKASNNATIATIEMVTDYLLPASDYVLIPRGYDITLTTAEESGGTYNYNGESEDGRAIISRDSENKESMIDAWNNASGRDTINALDNTTLRMSNLVFDGKSVRGSSDGGAVKSKYVNVYIDNVDFKNVYASNGGAMLIMFSAKDKNNKPTVQNTYLEVKNSDFMGCTSTTTETSNRLGGGAIVTNAATMTLDTCSFDTCTAVDQAGAVFHRVDGDYNTWTYVTSCTFANCSANAAGGLELDSKTIYVSDTTFNHCVAVLRNGGGFNVWPLNSGTTGSNCYVTVSGCTFNDCQLTAGTGTNGNGGGFRSAATYTTVINSTFTNNGAILNGGGFCVSNTNAKKTEVYGCDFERNSASYGGGIYLKAKEAIIDNCAYITTNQDITLTEADAKAGYFSKTEVNGDKTYAFATRAQAEAFKSRYSLSDEIETRDSEIKNCTSKNDGGGIYQDRNADGASLTINNSEITGNQTTNGGKNGGGVFTNARTVAISGSTISDNQATSKGGGMYAYSYTSLTINDSEINKNIAASNGGGVWFDADGDTNRNKQTLTIKGSTIDNNTSSGSGGGLYTLANTVIIGASETKVDSESGKPVRSSISGNTAKTNGGGLYQMRNVDGSTLTISSTDVDRNTANNTNTGTDQGGGGIYAGVRTLSITDSSASNNTAMSNGGGILFEINNDDARNAMSLTVEGCTIENNSSSRNGGGIYTKAKTAEIKAYTVGEGEDAQTTATKISNCTASLSGGGIYQSRNVEGSVLTITGSTIENCVSNDTNTGWEEHGGGGVLGYVRKVIVTDSTVSGNNAKSKGGGIVLGINNNAYSLTVDGDVVTSSDEEQGLIIDSSQITNNTSGNQGGGIATRMQLTLRNGTTITGNKLTTNTSADCAGVYLIDGRTLYLGPKDAAEGYTDTINVSNNTTANGTLSDLRLWEDSGENKQAVSAYVYCSLEGEIRVVNANKVGTWFATSIEADFYGFSDNDYVFKADHSTLHGIYDRNYSGDERVRIIWAGPPIAKITDGNGKILYLRSQTLDDGTTRGTSPAIFDRLGTGPVGGDYATYSSVAAFNMLCSATPELYNADGTLYEGTEYCIKMLDSFETQASMNVKYFTVAAERTITFTTAGTDADKEDGYPYVGSGTRATVIRGKSLDTSKSLLSVTGNLTIENIVVDGGSGNGVTPGSGTRCMWMGDNSPTVTLGEGAVLQNGSLNASGNGSGVFIGNGTFNIEGGVIRNCSANVGGGIYNNGGTIAFVAGNIYQCTATSKGGGVYHYSGKFNMSGGTISECSAGNGGGVWVRNNKSVPFNMSGGNIINNRAQTTGGGIAIEGGSSRLYFSGKVNVSGNTCEQSDAPGNACNLELNMNTQDVINVDADGGLLGGSYIGVYVPGTRDDDHPENDSDPYKSRGGEKDPFGSFRTNNTTTFYSFVNDRNGLKGGIIENPAPNTIYWIQIFSLKVTKNVVAGTSTTPEADEQFLFKVNIRGGASVTGQLNAVQIDSSTGDYGDMSFTSNGVDTTTAVFALKDGESATGINLSEGLNYEVIEYLTVDQSKKYAAMPMAGYSSNTEPLTVGDTTYTVVKANTYSSKIGENKSRRDVDPYTSALTFTNMMPVCKITDRDGNLLYRKYDWDKTTNKEGEGADGGESTKQPTYYAPAVYTELTGANGAFAALEGTLYTSNGSNPASWGVSNGVKIEMLVPEYSLSSAVNIGSGKVVTLTTASTTAALFPKQGDGTTSTIRRAFDSGSLFTVSGSQTQYGQLTLSQIILDGAKDTYSVETDGGIANVRANGKLYIQVGATLQNSRITGSGNHGGAVYVADDALVTMTGGAVTKNQSADDGAGIYLDEGGKLLLSGNPNFGGKGTGAGGNILTADDTNAMGNFKDGALVAKKNGGKSYEQARQDIYIAGYAGADDATNAESLLITDNISSGEGTIWVWAEQSPHYKTLQQFATIAGDATITEATCNAFRNAQDDKTTDNGFGDEYLRGTLEGDTQGYVYWSGIPGAREVVLRKVDATYQSLSGRSFAVYKGTSTTAYTPKGATNSLANLTSDENGCFWIGELPYGWYIVEEATNPHRYFYLVVEESGVYGTLGTDGKEIVDGYSSRADAETAAAAKYEQLRASNT